ncbi:DUF454 domain-containing protein [Aliikangiella marina]|uniref:Inner membrane protein n=1 Tax=Aliikangiella marina TaxID=1712262 RepID=A0A545TBS9_9GAMM|nr:YbaN family protein [Aliikangiella marina]TQV74683.1 DUF454 domain-containing protein [Aliikangiella marina]
MKNHQGGAVKYILIIVGLVLVAIGLIGIVVPGLPTTIFLIAAAGCFANSSPKLHGWLLSHPWFGPIIHHWHESRTIPLKAKKIALFMMVAACIYTWLMLNDIWIKLLITVIMLWPMIFVYRLPISDVSERED